MRIPMSAMLDFKHGRPSLAELSGGGGELQSQFVAVGVGAIGGALPSVSRLVEQALRLSGSKS